MSHPVEPPSEVRHVDEAIWQRHFQQIGPPLNATQFASFHQHLGACPECRKRFVTEQARARTSDQPLTDGQVRTVLSLLKEEDEKTQSRDNIRRWLWRVVGGLTLAGATAAVILLHGSPDDLHGRAVATADKRPSEFTARGDRSVPSREVRCFDERTHALAPMVEPIGYCAVGSKPTVHAKQILEYPWVSAVVCGGGDAWTCELVGSGRPAGPGDDVNIDGQPMQAGQRLRIFTVWSKNEVSVHTVAEACAILRRQKANPDATDSLPIADTKQLAHTAVAGPNPS